MIIHSVGYIVLHSTTIVCTALYYYSIVALAVTCGLSFPPWAIFSEGERGWVDWPEPAPRGSWIIAELCKWKIDSVG